jgi:hypothetical protein
MMIRCEEEEMGKLTAAQEAMARLAFERFLNECTTTPVLPSSAKENPLNANAVFG